MDKNHFERARDWLAQSETVVAFSGAGLSAESGLATFRDPDAESLWARFDPTELASPEGFAANPQRVIEWYRWRRQTLAGANSAGLANSVIARAG